MSVMVGNVSIPSYPIEKQDMPILAHRAARLRFHGDCHPFGTLTRSGAFGVDAMAQCGFDRMLMDETIHEHPPDLDGSCGFYALPMDMEPTLKSGASITLLVELYGRVIVCEKGYRAQFQRVVECRLPACVYCNRKPEVLHVVSHVLQEATCKKHNWQVDGYSGGVMRGKDGGANYVQLDIDDLDLPVAVTLDGRD